MSAAFHVVMEQRPVPGNVIAHLLHLVETIVWNQMGQQGPLQKMTQMFLAMMAHVQVNSKFILDIATHMLVLRIRP